MNTNTKNNNTVQQLLSWMNEVNIAESLDEQVLYKIGDRVIRELTIDIASRADWQIRYEKALKLANLVAIEKDFPWPKAANVMYPIITEAGINFASRAYPNIVQDTNVVKCRVTGPDREGEKAERAERISKHMSYQCLEQIEDWEGETDQLLTVLPIVGTAFRKTFHNAEERRHESMYISAADCVVNYNAKSLKVARRITHLYELYPNEIVENIRSGIFITFDYESSETQKDGQGGEYDEDAPHEFYEQHRWWDLDEDGYQEPYIITVHKATEKVVRIVARYDKDGILLTQDGSQIAKIIPVEYFTLYKFLNSLDSKIYGWGYGILLGAMNETINSTINQLLDAGTKQNTGGGFKDADLKLKDRNMVDGVSMIKPGEYKDVTFTGDDIRKKLYEVDNVTPSPVLYNLLGFLTEATKRLGSSVDVLSGEQIGANASPTTTLALIEQGLKVFSAIYKRIYRSLKQEFKKIFRLNKLYLDDQSYYMYQDEHFVIPREDYNDKDMDVVPVSDPKNVADIQRIMKAESLLNLTGRGLTDNEIYRRYCQALNVSEIDKIVPGEDEEQAPSMEEQVEAKKMELEERKIAIDERKLGVEIVKSKFEVIKIQQEAAKLKADAVRLYADAEAKEVGSQFEEYKAHADEALGQVDDLTKMIKRQGETIDKMTDEISGKVNVPAAETNVPIERTNVPVKETERSQPNEKT